MRNGFCYLAEISGCKVQVRDIRYTATPQWAEQAEFQWHHEWRVGDVLMWDNRCVMHHRDAFEPQSRRIMHKTMTEGERPFYAPTAKRMPPHPRGYAKVSA